MYGCIIRVDCTVDYAKCAKFFYKCCGENNNAVHFFPHDGTRGNERFFIIQVILW